MCAFVAIPARMLCQLGVNQQSIEQQEVLIGTIPARYGDVQSGVISITTKTGRSDFFGSIEGSTSTGRVITSVVTNASDWLLAGAAVSLQSSRGQDHPAMPAARGAPR